MSQTQDRSLLEHAAVASPRPVAALLAVALAVLIGVAFRVERWWDDVSFWSDEAFLLLNFRAYDLTRLLTGPLDAVSNTQAAPPLWLAGHSLLFDAVGANERLMRLPTLLASIFALPLIAWIGWRIAGPVAAVLATLLLALNERQLAGAANLKQYPLDVLISLLQTALVLMLARSGARPSILITTLATFSAVSVLLSHTAAITFAGLSLAILCSTLIDRRRFSTRFVIDYLASNAVFAAGFVALLLLSIRVQRDDFLYTFWLQYRGFPPSLAPDQLIAWWARAVQQVFSFSLFPLGWLLLIPWTIGLIALAKQRQWLVLFALYLPMAFAVIAAVAGQYPFLGKRVASFLVPSILLLSAFGASMLMQWVRGPLRFGALAIVLIALAFASWATIDRSIHRPPAQHLRLAIEHLRSERLDNTPVFAAIEEDRAVIELYAPDFTPRVIDDADLQALDQFWLVTSDNESLDRDALIHDRLKTSGFTQPDPAFARPGAWASRFVRNRPAEDRAQP